MTTTNPINYSLLKLYIDTIPNFNGDSHTLEVFLEHCEFLINTYARVDAPRDPINGFLIRAVIGKLTGNALMLVGSRPEIREWNSLKDLLRLSFGDNRNLDCLVQELIIMKPYKNESYVSFGQRIQKGRSAIASKLISMRLDAAERAFQIKNYDELSLKTFIRGLSGRIQDMVRLRNPDSLELAISYVIEEENFALNQKQFLNYNTKSENPNLFKNNIPKQSISSIPNVSQQSYYAQNSFPQRSQFPSQPINLQHRQNAPQRKFYTNAQVFGPRDSNASRVNVFKPTGQQQYNKPEPMSISTRNTNFANKQNNRNDYFKTNGPRNFVSQELNNIEQEPNTYVDNEYFEQPLEYQEYPIDNETVFNNLGQQEQYDNYQNFTEPTTSDNQT